MIYKELNTLHDISLAFHSGKKVEHRKKDSHYEWCKSIPEYLNMIDHEYRSAEEEGKPVLREIWKNEYEPGFTKHDFDSREHAIENRGHDCIGQVLFREVLDDN